MTDDGRTVPLEYLPAGGLTPKLGMALTLSGGKLTAVSGGEAPGYISMTERANACKDGEVIPVLRVGGDIIFAVPAADVPDDSALGGGVAIGGDGLTVTTGGSLGEVVGLLEDRVLVRLPNPGAAGGGGAAGANVLTVNDLTDDTEVQADVQKILNQ